MRKKYIFGKKLYISILTTIVVLLTTVATTFAWVGVFANSTFDTFNINIKPSEFDEYSIQISTDGINFPEDPYITTDMLKKQILLNWGYPEEQLTNNDTIDLLFSRLNQDQCTNNPEIVNNSLIKLNGFTDVYDNPTTKLFKFDFYISTKQNYEASNATDFMLDVFLEENALEGRTKDWYLINSITFPDSFNNPYNDLIQAGTFTLPTGYRTVNGGESFKTVKISSASAARIAFEKYEVVEKGHPEQYTSTSQPKSAIIYQQGYDYPVYDTINDVYDFGGILPNDYNFSTLNYNISEWQYAKRGYWVKSVPDYILEKRGVDSLTKDVVLTKETNHLIDSNNPNERIDVNHMMKVTFYFWFEGWDADCFNAINASPVKIKLSLHMTNEY